MHGRSGIQAGRVVVTYKAKQEALCNRASCDVLRAVGNATRLIVQARHNSENSTTNRDVAISFHYFFSPKNPILLLKDAA